MIRVSVHLKETSQPIVHEAVNAYSKGPFYCVYADGQAFKYPLADVWRVVEQYRPEA